MYTTLTSLGDGAISAKGHLTCPQIKTPTWAVTGTKPLGQLKKLYSLALKPKKKHYKPRYCFTIFIKLTRTRTSQIKQNSFQLGFSQALAIRLLEARNFATK